ncbi:hypothetical protein LWI28_025876 [Acer negundo]|uniref:RING-type E3 ubiquitin transferase n=1 Tax=Acer negundo TaxID=4023 RepID=A0AAD5J822_ACENE|nr:hypothetical protein LWI28_025876 [Acer negundo]
MVGCRYLGLNNQTLKNDIMDCEIHVNLQFPSLNAKKEEVYITGSISSLRDKSDPLHFESVYVSSTSFYTWRIDTEIFMVMISNTLACIFLMFQLLYVKTHPGVLPFISLLMLVVLTLGHMMLLLLNFEAWIFQSQNRQTVLLGSGGWPEVYVALVAFVCQFRLLKLSWSSRLAFHKSQKASLIAEKKAWYVSLPLYLTGFLISEFVNLGRKNKDVGITMQSSRLFNMQQHSLWGGLILDGFLFPQILLNILRNSTEKALSPLFYIGYTSSRVVPQSYDLYRAHNSADHEADFYSIERKPQLNPEKESREKHDVSKQSDWVDSKEKQLNNISSNLKEIASRRFISSSSSSSSSSSTVARSSLYGFRSLFKGNYKTSVRNMSLAASVGMENKEGLKVLVLGAPNAQKMVGIWLFGSAAWVFSMVVLGGVTQLTRSGLSMTDWKFTGGRPPLSDEEWFQEFEKYKQSP